MSASVRHESCVRAIESAGLARGECCGRCSGATWIATHAAVLCARPARQASAAHRDAARRGSALQPVALRRARAIRRDRRPRRRHRRGDGAPPVRRGCDRGTCARPRSDAPLDPPGARPSSAQARVPARMVTHEATVKCRGTGLATPSQGSFATELWTAQLDVGPQAAVAVAVDGGRCELALREWSGQGPRPYRSSPAPISQPGAPRASNAAESLARDRQRPLVRRALLMSEPTLRINPKSRSRAKSFEV